MNASIFQALCRSHGLPSPEPEFAFAKPRKWRFDWVWIETYQKKPGLPMAKKMVALEIEGGAWTRGRHTRGKGFVADIEKYNEGVLRGWKILRCTPEQVESGEVFALLKRALS